jgi:hypothetical protein
LLPKSSSCPVCAGAPDEPAAEVVRGGTSRERSQEAPDEPAAGGRQGGSRQEGLQLGEPRADELVAAAGEVCRDCRRKRVHVCPLDTARKHLEAIRERIARLEAPSAPDMMSVVDTHSSARQAFGPKVSSRWRLLLLYE